MVQSSIGQDMLDDIGHIFTTWIKDGQLYNNFLVQIADDICTRHYSKGDDSSSRHVLDDIEDKVVQDADNTEGTGVWSVQETVKAHIPAPTIAASHLLRVASANRPHRTGEFIEDLRGAVYASFAQSCNLISTTSYTKKWHIKMSEVIRIWRSGCIVQSDYIADLLQPLFLGNEKSNDEPVLSILLLKPVAADIEKDYPKLKRVVLKSIQYSANVPTLTASLEYFKYMSSTELPTQFMEAELNYVGAHSYDLKSEHAMNIKKGTHHYEWKKP